LIFEGLDTFATVFLNGKEILKSENMFLPARVDVKALLKTPGEENELSILFESALRKGTELEEKFGTRASMMRDKRRMLMRKAQVSRSWLYD
jgi:beta-mannosidase